MNELLREGDENQEEHSIEEELETPKQREMRIGNLWRNYKEIQKDEDLMNLFDNQAQFNSNYNVEEILDKNNFPERTKISELDIAPSYTNINPKFIKDGFVYLLRGDYPDKDKKGFYTRTYGYGKLTTKQLSESLHDPREAGYFLYGGDERYLKNVPYSNNTAEELAYLQSAKGGSSFISTTTSISRAQTGTGNEPDPEEQKHYEIYAIKVPIDSAISSNTNNYFGFKEDEVLVPDYISKEEIIAKFPRDKTEDIYQYFHNILGVTKEDMRFREKTE